MTIILEFKRKVIEPVTGFVPATYSTIQKYIKDGVLYMKIVAEDKKD